MCIPDIGDIISPISNIGGGGGRSNAVAPKAPPENAAFDKDTDEAARAKRRRGKRSTLLTGPQGLLNEEVPILRKTVLGS